MSLSPPSPAAGPRRFSVSRLFQPEVVYPLMLLVWGTVLAFVLPPIQCPDEGSHAIRTFHLAAGRILPDGVTEGFHSAHVPASLNKLFAWMCPRVELDRPQRRLTPEEWDYLSSVRVEGDPEEPTWYGMMSYNCFIPYVPQATGVYLARKLGGSLLTAFFAGRLANLLVCVLALHLALRLMPFYRNLLGVVALLPISVQQMATLSADAFGLACCFVFTALIFRLLAPADRKPGWLALLGLCGASLLLPICKVPYALLTLLYLAVRPARLGSWRRYLLVGCALVAVTLLGALISLKASKGATRLGEGFPKPTVSRTRQAAYVRHHPLRFGRILTRTTLCWGWFYCEHMTTLASNNLRMSNVPSKACLLFLALVALLDRRRDWSPGWRLHLVALSLSVIAFVAFHLMLYLVWNPVECAIIDGFQGRYILGFLPSFLLLLYNRVVHVSCPPRALLILSLAAMTGVQAATIHTIVCAFYLPPKPPGSEPGSNVLLLVGGLLFLTTLMVVCRQRQGGISRKEQIPQAAQDRADCSCAVKVRELSRAG